MKKATTKNHKTPPLRQGAVSGCPYLSAQLAILKELERIAKLPPTKTFKGTLIRTANCVGLVKQISELELRKRGRNVVPDFAVGGIVNGVSADKIFLDGKEYIIPNEIEDPQ